MYKRQGEYLIILKKALWCDAIRSHHIRWIAIVLGYIERSYDDLGPYKSRVYNLNSTIMTDPYMVLESERAYELLAGYGYCWVHTVPRCCYPACRSIGTLPAGPSLKVGYILTDPGDHAEGSLLWSPHLTYGFRPTFLRILLVQNCH